MIIFAHDVGSRNWGWSVLELTHDTKKYLDSGYLNLKEEHIGRRMLGLEKHFETILQKYNYKIDQVAFEMPYLRGNNMVSVLYCTGMLYRLAALHDIPIKSYTATEVKLAVSGSGKSDKLELELASKNYLDLPLEITFANDHETDALAIGICHFMKS